MTNSHPPTADIAAPGQTILRGDFTGQVSSRVTFSIEEETVYAKAEEWSHDEITSDEDGCSYWVDAHGIQWCRDVNGAHGEPGVVYSRFGEKSGWVSVGGEDDLSLV